MSNVSDFSETDARNLQFSAPQADAGYQSLVNAVRNPNVPTGRVRQLQLAGFSPDEIAQYSAKKRQELTLAGFNDKEIDSYLTGIDVPELAPKPFVDRFIAGLKAQPQWRIVSAMGKGFAEGFGSEPLGITDEDAQKLRDIGLWGPGPNGQGGPLRFANEALMRPAVTLMQAILRGGNAVVTSAGAGIGQLAEEAGAPSPEGPGHAAEDFAEMTQIGTMLLGSVPFYHIGPRGDVQVSRGLPKAEAFDNAAVAIGGELYPQNVTNKLLTLWETKGIHPSEVAHEAMNDPVVKQEMLSADSNLPAIYGGKQPYNQPDGGAIPEPPLEGEIIPPGGSGGKPPPEEPPLGTAHEGTPQIEGPHSIQSFEEASKGILERLSIGEPSNKLPYTMDRFITDVSDQLYPIFKKAPEVYPVFRLLSGTQGMIDHFLTKGTFDFNSFKNVSEPLMNILADAKDDFDGFRSFVTALHALELERKNIRSGFRWENIEGTLINGREKWGVLAMRLAQYNHSLLNFVHQSGIISKPAYDYMMRNYHFYLPFSRLIDEDMLPGGLKYTPQETPLYDPVGRIKGAAENQKTIDPLENVIRNTHLFITMAMRNEARIKLVDLFSDLSGEKALMVPGERNTALSTEVRNYANQFSHEPLPWDLQDLMTFMAGQRLGRPGEINLFRNGVKETYVVDEDLAEAVNGLDLQSISLISKIAAPFAQTMRAGYVLSPAFWARFVMREPWYAAATYEGEGIFTPWDMVKGMVLQLVDNDKSRSYLKSGGAHNSIVALDRDYLGETLESLRKLNDETGLFDRSWNTLWGYARHPAKSVNRSYAVNALRMITNTVMNSAHYGAYLKQLKEYERKGIPLSEMSKEQIRSAGWVSRQTGIDNTVIGAKMRGYNLISAFFNATIRDPIKMFEAGFTNPKTRAKFLITTAAMVAGSALLWFANKNNKNYQQAPQWQKDQNWIFADDLYNFNAPKPFTYGILVGTGTEHLLDYLAGKDPRIMDWFNSTLNSTLPSMLPVIAGPAAQQWANESSFGGPLIPEALKDGLPEYQYNNYTTELSKLLGSMVSSIPGMRDLQTSNVYGSGIARAVGSPILIENYIQGWSGDVGMRFLQLADLALRKAGVAANTVSHGQIPAFQLIPDPTKPEMTLADIPFIKAFIKRHPDANTGPIEDFYKNYNSMLPYYKSFQQRAKMQDPVAVAFITKIGGPLMFVRLDKAHEALSRQRLSINLIYENPKFSASDKRQMIDSLYEQMIITAAGANIMNDTITKALEAATKH